MITADIVYSPDDNGYYAVIWEEIGTKMQDIAAVPEGNAVFNTRGQLITALRKKYGEIEMRETSASSS